ncbi:MAG: class I SAM-dependent methyltransferase [Intrasporangium sp.]|uniref:class I SAM-dependent methyltransferase n=1 Tax=Intrasporangium sp. TaxID=1925024 RepID=UPI002647EFBE|nr:class I SAM-dependent methyltransferase [Intrasporangium sp.]MDN5798061.1 class I SAM-dependent methyltransferase [Intrasporangium sp.]
MTPSERGRVDRVLHDARVAAYPPGEYIGQESFMTAGGILALGRRAGVGPAVHVLDLCCGLAGPGRYLTRELGCRYLGVDQDPSAIDLARQRSAGLPCRFVTAIVPPVPPGDRDVVLLLETLLAFRDKRALVSQIAAVLRPGGRFACTVEDGMPLTARERAAMPQADTVWPIPLPELESLLAEAGLTVTWRHDDSASHLAVVDALVDAFTTHLARIAAELGASAIDELLAGHRLWSSWLRSGRVRKVALVAQRR